jgi:hypothetical protein
VFDNMFNKWTKGESTWFLVSLALFAVGVLITIVGVWVNAVLGGIDPHLANALGVTAFIIGIPGLLGLLGFAMHRDFNS